MIFLLLQCPSSLYVIRKILHYFLDKTDISRHFLRCFMKNETEIKVATLTKYKASYVHIQERSLQDKIPPFPPPSCEKWKLMFFPILNSKNFELKMTKIAHIHHQTFFSHSKKYFGSLFGGNWHHTMICISPYTIFGKHTSNLKRLKKICMNGFFGRQNYFFFSFLVQVIFEIVFKFQHFFWFSWKFTSTPYFLLSALLECTRDSWFSTPLVLQ